jgi:hypothetical protein
VIAEMLLAYLAGRRIYEAKQRHIYRRSYMPSLDSDALMEWVWPDEDAA